MIKLPVEAPITLADIAVAAFTKTAFHPVLDGYFTHRNPPSATRPGQHLELWGNILSDVSQPAPTLRFFYVLRIIKMFVKNWQQNYGSFLPTLAHRLDRSGMQQKAWRLLFRQQTRLFRQPLGRGLNQDQFFDNSSIVILSSRVFTQYKWCKNQIDKHPLTSKINH